MEHCLLRKHAINLNLVEDTSCRFCKLGDETPLHLFSRCNAGQNVQKSEIAPDEDGRSSKSGGDPYPKLLSGSGVGYLMTGYPRTKNGGEIDLVMSSCVCYSNFTIHYNGLILIVYLLIKNELIE